MVKEFKSANDMNKLEQVETGLQDRERYFGAIFNQTFQFIAFIKSDGTVIEVNQATLDFAGLDRIEVIGRLFWQIRWWVNSQQIQTLLHGAIARAAKGELTRFEVDVLDANNAIATIEFSIQPIRDEIEQIDLLLWEGRDISDKKRAETEIRRLNVELKQSLAQCQALKEALNCQKQKSWQCETQAQTQLEFYTNIVNNMQFGLLVWQLEDPNDITSLRLIAANPAASELVGIAMENKLGWRITECFPNLLKQHRAYLELYAQVALSGQGQKQHEDYYSDEYIAGSYFNVKTFPLPKRCVGVVFDNITESKLAEQAFKQRAEELTRTNTILAKTATLLKKRNDELDQFAYVASHDLKAPLRAIASLSEWIEEDLQEQIPEENQHQMRLLRGRVRRMEALINGLLEYCRVGRVQNPVSVVDVDELIREIIDSLAPPSTFIIEVEPAMPILKTKRLPIQQVFTNLIGNAIVHHTRVDGHVKISVKDQGDYYEFAVADNGPGIAPEYQDKVFVIFQTLQARDRKESTGIGLAIVKKIVETETGTISLESQLGAGCTFRFTWPKQPKE